MPSDTGSELAERRPLRNRTPLIGWHPPADQVEWLRAEETRRGGKRGVRSEILTEALALLRERSQS